MSTVLSILLLLLASFIGVTLWKLHAFWAPLIVIGFLVLVMGVLAFWIRWINKMRVEQKVEIERMRTEPRPEYVPPTGFGPEE